MKKTYFAIFFGLLAVGVAYVLIKDADFSRLSVLNTKGVVGNKERSLIIVSTILMLIVVIPVFILTFFISWKYREGSSKKNYRPDWDHSRSMEITWWAIPSIIILVLAVLAWNSSHTLDPFKPLASTKAPLKIQVVALQWKWLFIYPEQNIATINTFEMPVNTPVEFEITSDAPMNSFWIPQLGGQIYAMSGMSTTLSLMADQVGSYNGSSANISGKGFSNMKFSAVAVEKANFDQWVKSVKNLPVALSSERYQNIAQPSDSSSSAYFSSVENNLYDKVVLKYTRPGGFDANASQPEHSHGSEVLQ